MNADSCGLKIAFIGHKRIQSREGGIEIVVGELSHRLAKKGCSVTVYNRTGNHVSGKEYNRNREQQQDKEENIIIVNVPTIDKRGIDALSSSFIATIMAMFQCLRNRDRFDCIHYHAEGPSVMLLLPHLFGIRTVVTIHGLDWKRAKWSKFASGYLKFGEKIAAKYADEVIVLSRNTQLYFKKTYNRDTTYIPNGISEVQIYSPEEIYNRWGLSKGQYILYLGRLVPEKGIHILINAFLQVRTDKKLIIAGGLSGIQSYHNELQQLAKKDSRVDMIGFVEGQALEELYSNCYVYCLPSYLEGMPLSLLEALSYGNCCIVSDIPECTEVVEEYALTFPCGDQEKLAEVLQLCCDDEQFVQEYRKRSGPFIRNKYNWEFVVDQTLKLYSKQ